MPRPQKVFEIGCCVSSSFVQSCSRQKTRLARLKNGLTTISYSVTAEFDISIFTTTSGTAHVQFASGHQFFGLFRFVQFVLGSCPQLYPESATFDRNEISGIRPR
jgi:hypothetical protein